MSYNMVWYEGMDHVLQYGMVWYGMKARCYVTIP